MSSGIWLVVACLVMAASAASGESLAETISPDGQARYACGAERDSAAGCFNAWTKISHDGRTGGWIPAYCRDQPDDYSTGHCYGGAVPWWWWNGSGRIGDAVLRDFWYRDYAGPEVNGVFRNNNSYGDAHRIPGPDHCYEAKGSVFCMQFMEP